MLLQYILIFIRTWESRLLYGPSQLPLEDALVLIELDQQLPGRVGETQELCVVEAILEEDLLCAEAPVIAGKLD